MPSSIRDLVARLNSDSWRAEQGFSADIVAVHEILEKSAHDTAAAQSALNAWIRRYQPCLFGRIAAQASSIAFCILSPADLVRSDDDIAATIQSERSKWKERAYSGASSAFVIAALSPIVAGATPNEAMRDLATRLCELYLLRDDIRTDEIYLDSVEIEVPRLGKRSAAIAYDVGVNYFCAQGDQRWWHDHRFPGGMAFSMNSVGHMVRSSILQNAMAGVQTAALNESANDVPNHVESLDKALVLAMRTIANASNTEHGPATMLLSIEGSRTGIQPACPVDLPAVLQQSHHCNYLGRYHTDITLPSEYFLPTVARPSDLKDHILDFTYLFDNRLDNPSYTRMGKGVKSRGMKPEGNQEDDSERTVLKRGKAIGRLRS